MEKRKTAPSGAKKKRSLAQRRREMLQRASTMGQNTAGIGHAPKERDLPKPITLPKLKFMED